MKRYLAALLMLGACGTPQVTATCHDVHEALKNPLLDFAPSEIKALRLALLGGTYVCGTPEYAAARERVLGYIRR